MTIALSRGVIELYIKNETIRYINGHLESREGDIIISEEEEKQRGELNEKVNQ